MEYLQTSENYLKEVDENKQAMINPTYYKNIIIDKIENYLHENDLQKSKLTNNNMLSICQEIYETIFTSNHTPTRKNDNTPKCNIPYTQYNISTLLNIYKSTLIKYNCMPSMYGFSILTGISEDTVKKYVTPASVEMTNIRREMLRNELSNDRMGRIVLANNDTSYGLEYEKKQAVDRETIKQGLGVSDLPRLE